MQSPSLDRISPPDLQVHNLRGARRASAELHDHVTTLRGTLSAMRQVLPVGTGRNVGDVDLREGIAGLDRTGRQILFLALLALAGR
jgi:hypothetical protein